MATNEHTNGNNNNESKNNNNNNGNNNSNSGTNEPLIEEQESPNEELKTKEYDIKTELKNKILAEIKEELFLEMKNKNEQLEQELNALKMQLEETQQNKNKKKRKRSVFSRHRAVESMHNEWPKLDSRDRASLRKKLAKEIKQHHNKRKKRTFKLEKKRLKKQKKLMKYEREISSFEKQLRKHGVKYVGPPEEDGIYRLICCLAYKSDGLGGLDGITETETYERRHSISHQAAKMEERQIQRKWAELFTDLIFVAIIVKFASQINSQYIYYCKLGDVNNMVSTLLNGLLFFLPFWCLWLELTVTLIRFHDFEGKWYGLVDDTLIFIILAGVIEISFQIDINADLFAVQYANRFLLGFGLCIIALLLLHIFYRWKLKDTARRYCRRRIYSYTLSFLVLFVSIIDITNPLYIIFAITCSCCIMLYVSLVSFRVYKIGNNIHNIYCLEQIVERFGIFSMIVIGESILALLISPDPGSFIRYICVYFAFGLLFLFQLMYFGSHASEACHALHKITSPGAVAWIFIHLPLSTSLLFVGIGLRLLVTFADLDSIPPQISCILVIGTEAAIICYYILRQCHEKYMFTYISLLLRIIPIIICPICLLIDNIDSFGIILWCFIVAVSSYFYDIILINEYETKPIWMNELIHEYQSGHCGEFEFHPEEYNPIWLPIDSWLFCRNYDGEHGRTIIVSLAEYIVDDQTLHTIHEIEHSHTQSTTHFMHSITAGIHEYAPAGIHIQHTKDLHLPKSPKIYLDQISHKIDVSTNVANLFHHTSSNNKNRRHSMSKSKSKSKKKENVLDVSSDDDEIDMPQKLKPKPKPTTPYSQKDPSIYTTDHSYHMHGHAHIMPNHSNQSLHSNYANKHHAHMPRKHSGTPPLPPLTPPNNIDIKLQNTDSTHRKVSNNTPSINIQLTSLNLHDNDVNSNKSMTPMHTDIDPSIIVHKTPTVLGPNTPINIIPPNNHSSPFDIAAGALPRQIDNQLTRGYSIRNHEAAIMEKIAATKQQMLENRQRMELEEREYKQKEAALHLFKKHHKTKLLPSASSTSQIHNNNKLTIESVIPQQKDAIKLRQPSRTSSVNIEDEVSHGKMTIIPAKIPMQRMISHEKSDGAGVMDWGDWVHEFEEEHEENEEHRHQWFSEFADLVFVAIIINFADQIKNISINKCVSAGDMSENYIELNCLSILFVEAGIFFLSFFMVWYELSVTLIRFTDIPGVFDDILKFLYLGGIVTMTLQMSSEEFLSYNISGFITGIIMCLLCMTLLHIVYYFNVENCQLYARKRIILYFLSIIILFVVSIIDSIFISELSIIIISITILWISSNSFRVILTPNDEMLELPEDVFEKIVERWGIFVMIATGESILALVATTNKLTPINDSGGDSQHLKEQDIAFQHYISILCAFGITYLVSHYYLESSKINSMHFHALMHPGSPGSVLWTLLHGILAFFLMLVGAGWKLLLLSLSLEICWIDAEKYYLFNTKEASKHVLVLKQECCIRYHILGNCYEYNGNGWIEFSIILGCSLTLSLITMYLLRTSHPKFIFSWKSIICRFPIIFIIPAGAYWTNSFQTQSFYYSVWCLILMTISYFVDHLFIDIYQSDIKPELRTFYNTQIAPELRQQTLQLHLMESKRRSLEFGRSSSLSINNHNIKKREFSSSQLIH